MDELQPLMHKAADGGDHMWHTAHIKEKDIYESKRDKSQFIEKAATIHNSRNFESKFFLKSIFVGRKWEKGFEIHFRQTKSSKRKTYR